MNANRKSWAETPSEVKDVYGEEYFDAFCRNIAKQMTRARSNVHEVVEQMVEAVTTENPKIRYVPYWISFIRAQILMYLPEKTKDKFFGSVYKIDGHLHKDKAFFHRQNSTRSLQRQNSSRT